MSVSVRAAAILLGTNASASAKEKKAAFRALAKRWHPDLHQGKPTAALAEAKFKQILEAYSVLEQAAAQGSSSVPSGTWRDSVYRGSHHGYWDRWQTKEERERGSGDANHAGNRYYGPPPGAAPVDSSQPSAHLAVMAFVLGLSSLVWAVRRESGAAHKHDPDWITRRSMGGWRGSKSMGSSAARLDHSAASQPRRSKSNTAAASREPNTHASDLPRQVRPYDGSSVHPHAPAAHSTVQIGDSAHCRSDARKLEHVYSSADRNGTPPEAY